MEVRGKETFELFFRFVELIASRISMHEVPTVPQKTRLGSTSEIAPVGTEAISKTTQLFSFLRPPVSTADQQDTKKEDGKNELISALSWWSNSQLDKIPGNSLAAFANHQASIPGKHGIPYTSRISEGDEGKSDSARPSERERHTR